MYTLIFHFQKKFYNIFRASPDIWNSIVSIPNSKTEKKWWIKTLTHEVAQKIRKKLWSKVTKKNISSPQEYRNIIRKYNIVSIWDLHWSYDALMWNLLHAWLIDTSGNWIWWTTRVIFHGDIFADRHQDSLKIATYISNLWKKARSQSGDISILAWNHEDIAFAFLTHQSFCYEGKWIQMKLGAFKSSNQWLLELMIHANKINPNEESLKTLQWDQYSRNALEFMCNMKLIVQLDDTLFIHVVPHPELLRLVLQIGTNEINRLYQKWMRTYLLWTSELTENEKIEFHNLRKIFLDTQHRKMMVDPIYKEIKKNGINLIINGHDHKNAWEIDLIHWVECTGVDFWYMKWGSEIVPSTLEIQTNGYMKYGNRSTHRSKK